MNITENKWSDQTRRNTKNLALWTGAWLVTMAIASFGPILIWDYNVVLSILAITFNTAIGVGMILANIRHLKGLDEMQRKLHLEAMAVTLGVAVVGGLSYSMLDVAKVISSHAEISFLVILIGITYMIALLIGSRRYK